MNNLVSIEEVIAVITQHHFDNDKNNFDLLLHNLCKEIELIPTVEAYTKTEIEESIENVECRGRGLNQLKCDLGLDD